jgi:hypothetical protein
MFGLGTATRIYLVPESIDMRKGLKVSMDWCVTVVRSHNHLSVEFLRSWSAISGIFAIPAHAEIKGRLASRSSGVPHCHK